MNKKQKKMLTRILIAAVMMVVLELLPTTGILRFVLYMIPYLVIGYDILRKAFRGILNRRIFDENFLMVVATLGAIAVGLAGTGDYTEAIAVMLFYQIGELFQSYAVGKSRKNISELMDIRPDYANVEQEGELVRVDPDEVAVGTEIIVQPGEKVPIDGIVVEGYSTLNTSALTGESLPREIVEGEEIISGCINMTRVLRVKTTKEFGESTVSKILELVENSTSHKSRSEAFITKFAKYYTPVVCYGALALALLPPLARMLFFGLPADWGTWFGMELVDVTEVVKDSEFVVFKGAIEAGGTVRGINAKGQGGMPRKKIDKLVSFAKDFGAKGLAYIAVQEDGTVKYSFAKFMTEEEMQNLIQAMDGENGDLLLFAADRNKVVWDVLGNLRLELARQMELLDKNEYKFLWITEFPLLEWSEEQNRFTAMHHPFTMPMEEDLQYLDSDPGRVRAKAYDITLNGNEIGGGSIRIHQNDIQEKMFEVLGFTKEQAYEQFAFLLNAFKYGVPPHAGLAYGLDRLVMLMAKVDSIRDVMAFPKVKDASCLMTEAPSMADDKQLAELGLELRPEEKDNTEE